MKGFNEVYEQKKINIITTKKHLIITNGELLKGKQANPNKSRAEEMTLSLDMIHIEKPVNSFNRKSFKCNWQSKRNKGDLKHLEKRLKDRWIISRIHRRNCRRWQKAWDDLVESVSFVGDYNEEEQ